ncbi:unnamed protein product [Bursaphelenchus xylophilus]|uniref:(pine wood nematode) hypothetical protein n=1 Tax=Bursaphelenchus xylophilus TaxID=6326 RepID=A0A1I7S6K7_BURXY|nr:unnamed protein product [Bursaphelenchus xylophilus]CAG9120522.1 unnamed protein product [Bursaphelenchus xylophilus]
MSGFAAYTKPIADYNVKLVGSIECLPDRVFFEKRVKQPNRAVRLYVTTNNSTLVPSNANFFYYTMFQSTTLLVFIPLIAKVAGLSCFSNENGFLEVIEDSDFKYCVTIPAGHDKDGQPTNASQYGLTADMDDMGGYDEMFVSTTLLSLCIQEKYDIAAIVKKSYGPKFVHKLPEPEYMTRCLCSTNYCNKGTTIEDFYSEQLKIFV